MGSGVASREMCERPESALYQAGSAHDSSSQKMCSVSGSRVSGLCLCTIMNTMRLLLCFSVREMI